MQSMKCGLLLPMFRARSACLPLCLLVTTVSAAKMAKPIEMWTCGAQGIGPPWVNLRRPGSSREGALLGHQSLLAVDILNISRDAAYGYASAIATRSVSLRVKSGISDVTRTQMQRELVLTPVFVSSAPRRRRPTQRPPAASDRRRPEPTRPCSPPCS